MYECMAVDDHGYEITFDPTNLQTEGVGSVKIDAAGGLDGVSCASYLQCTAVDEKGNEVTVAAPASQAPDVHGEVARQWVRLRPSDRRVPNDQRLRGRQQL